MKKKTLGLNISLTLKDKSQIKIKLLDTNNYNAYLRKFSWTEAYYIYFWKMCHQKCLNLYDSQSNSTTIYNSVVFGSLYS